LSIDTTLLRRSDVAWLVGMSDSWVRDRIQDGSFPAAGTTTADEYVEAFVTYKLSKLVSGEGGMSSLEAEKTRLTKEQADKVATSNAIDRKELASLPDMTNAVVTVIELSLSRLMRVPSIVAKGDEALRKRIETAITDALEDLSATRVEELTGGGLDEEDPDEEED
jgi:phage terminase Nu1 subunit (DNA packaging protein)